MEGLGLEVFEQQFTFSHKLLRGLGNVSSSNLYAIMRSRSGSRTEALVVVAPLRGSGESEVTISGSYAYLLSLAKQLSSQLYWAKDIIFLFPDMEYVGLIAWLDAYHGVTTSSIVQGSKLDGRSGGLQAGIVLEFPSLNLAQLDVSYQGINGELPNLDLINTVARLARKHGIPLSLHGQPQGFIHSSPLPNIRQLISSIWLQGSGSPSGLHGPLINFQIPCLTLRGIPSANQNPNAQFVRQVGSLIEGFLRCLNNLQERMHQSFYYYLLPDLWHYISIGVYTPFFCIALAGILIQVFRVYIELTVPEAHHSIITEPTAQPRKDCSPSQNDHIKEEATETDVRQRFKNQTLTKVSDIVDEQPSRTSNPVCKIATDIFPALTSLALCFAGGAVIYELPEFIYSRLIPLSIEHPSTVWKTAELSVATGFSLTTLGLAFILPVLASVTKSPWLGYCQKWRLSCAMAALLWSAFLGCLSPLNISTSFLLLTVFEPVILLIISLSKPARLHRIFTILALLASSPPSLVVLGTQLHPHIPQYPPATFKKATFLVDLHEICGKVLCQAHMEASVLGSWSWSLLSVGVVPLWLFTWNTVLLSME
nr:glycosylphosphatidylinositol anchor attachment 1 [Hymenolepis microstoma]